jgi:Uncharacterized protein conserved in bacteria
MTAHGDDNALIQSSEDHLIVFYDGVCRLCNGFVTWVMEHDPKGNIRFCALQSPQGTALIERLGMSNNMSTTIGLFKGQIYLESDVLRMVLGQLGGAWSISLPLFYLPSGIKNRIYRWIARNRYQWFGQKKQCMMSVPDEDWRFICSE